jgi:glycosyltransferase involved in cell wall biosynthesis
MKKEPLVSIIIPTYNEEKDIARVLDSVLALDYQNKEIIVIDINSIDNTRYILDAYRKYPNVKLIFEEERRGVSPARNKGILSSKGEILIILNADVLLPGDFIKRILPHYSNGAGFVICESVVLNQEGVYGRWAQAKQIVLYSNNDDIVWSEGFSCLRKLAIRVGLFPEELGSNTAGEDAIFGENLLKYGKRVIDRKIAVSHYVPTDYRTIFKQRLGRGRGTIFIHIYINKIGLCKTLAYLLKESFLHIFYCSTILPFFINAVKLVKHSKKKVLDFCPFLFFEYFDSTVQLIGEWDAFFEIKSRGNKFKK